MLKSPLNAGLFIPMDQGENDNKTTLLMPIRLNDQFEVILILWNIKTPVKAKSIKNLLSDYFKGSDFKEINETINLNKSWNKIVGKTISKKTEIVSIKNGKIIIKTTNPIWRNELTFQKEDLLNRLKKEEQEINIKEIEFR